MRPNTEFSVFTSTTSGFDAVLMTRAGSSRGGSGLPKQARVVVVGDTCVSEQGMAAIVGRDKRYRVSGGAHGFYDAGELIRKHQPDILLIEPFLEDRDGIRSIRILIVSRQSERVYAERALQVGAAGYWMKNGSAEELMRAVETVAAGKIYVSPLIASLALEKFAHREILPQDVKLLTDRELAVFALIAAEQSVGRIGKKLGISRTTVETHCAHIKLKLGYPNAEALKQGARELLGTGSRATGSPQTRSDPQSR